MAAYISGIAGNWSAKATWQAFTKTGTITTSTASPNVVGVGTLFVAEVPIGSDVRVAGVLVGTVQSVTDNTHLAFTGNAASTNAGVAYKSIPFPPGNGDTVTIGTAVTIDTNTTVGSSPSTGGTAAIALIGTGSALDLTIGSGVTLIAKGDIAISNSGSVATRLVLSAGASVVLTPPSGQQYKIDCAVAASNAYPAGVVCNGSSGSHCGISTDKTASGLSGYINTDAAARTQGLITATYTDFVDLGTSSISGVQSHQDTSGAISITNCTFTRCNYYLNSTATTQNVAFTSNIFTSSVLITLNGVANCCAGFAWSSDPASGTRTIDSCSFDATLGNGSFRKCIYSNNYSGVISYLSGTNWPTDSYWFNNIVVGSTDIIMTLFGPIKNSYFFHTAASNPHYVGSSTTITSATVTGCIFETSSTVGDGDCIITPTSSGTFKILNCLGVPTGGGAGASCGNLVSCLNTGSVAITVEHCTWPSRSTDGGLVGLSETAASYAGEIASCRSNIVWALSATGTHRNAVDLKGVATNTLDAVTVADYNAFLNPSTSNITAAGSTVSATGYAGIKITAAYPSSQLGAHDLVANPTFTDNTRCLSTWGGTTAGGGVATNAGALATLAANPTLLAQATTGLWPWVLAGWSPTNVAFQAASYPGDASTTDAAGNAWLGGTPGVGAMAWQSTGGPWPFFTDQQQSGGFWEGGY